MLKIYLIVGEASGDNIGAKLMKALKNERADLVFYGLAGEKMQAQGMQSLFPIQELSIMGFFEVLCHIPKLWLRVRQTIKDIKKINPDIVITIDSPGFSFPLARALKGKISAKLVHYVAPTVWAYKPQRAKKIAAIYDHLLAVLPFEPPYFLKEGLNTSFIGYPALEDLQVTSKEYFRYKHKLAKGDILLCMTPGSREQEIKKMLPIFLDAVELLAKYSKQNIILVTPCHQHLAPLIQGLQRKNISHILIDEKDKHEIFSACDLALTKSGTVTTELAFYNAPMVVAHRVHPITNWLIRRMLKIQYATIINLLADEEIIPELLQEQCNALTIAQELQSLLELGPRHQQITGINDNISKLYVNEQAPSVAASKIILELVSAATDGK